MIEACGLTKMFGRMTAVDNLTFQVLPGRVTGFLGPNGAGKSTTMRMIMGLDLPTDGIAMISGRPFGQLRRPLHHVGALLEARAWHSGRSAYNHLLCLAQSNGIAARRVTEVLELVGLAGVGRKRAGTFSLGMGQRLGIAAALLGDPPVILCDEPVNGLDPEGISWIRGLLRSLAAEGRTILVSSHLMSEMALTADHLIVLGRGKLIADARTSDFIAAAPIGRVMLRTPEAGRFARLLTESGATVSYGDEPGLLLVDGLSVDSIGDLAASHGLTIHGLGQDGAALEAAYLELTRDSVEHRSGSNTSNATGAEQ